MVRRREEGVLLRRVELGQHALILSAAEIRYGGFVVIGAPEAGAQLAVGEELLVCGKDSCQRAAIQSIQLSGNTVTSATGDGKTRFGVRLSRRSPPRAQLRRASVTQEAGNVQLTLEDAMPAQTDVADTDLAESVEAESGPPSEGEGQQSVSEN